MSVISKGFKGLIITAWFAGFLFPSITFAGSVFHYYCTRDSGGPFKDFALVISLPDRTVNLKLHNGPESPDARTYRGKLARYTPSGNVVIDFSTYAKTQFYSYFPDMIFTRSLLVGARDGAIRVWVNANSANDVIMRCETRRLFN